ncbi:unnamed protein product [Ectocarpus sp. 12 AP-2014]
MWKSSVLTSAGASPLNARDKHRPLTMDRVSRKDMISSTTWCGRSASQPPGLLFLASLLARRGEERSPARPDLLCCFSFARIPRVSMLVSYFRTAVVAIVD